MSGKTLMSTTGLPQVKTTMLCNSGPDGTRHSGPASFAFCNASSRPTLVISPTQPCLSSSHVSPRLHRFQIKSVCRSTASRPRKMKRGDTGLIHSQPATASLAATSDSVAANINAIFIQNLRCLVFARYLFLRDPEHGRDMGDLRVLLLE